MMGGVLFIIVALGSTSLCFADQIIGNNEGGAGGGVHRSVMSPTQKLNELLNHVPGVPPLPLLGNVAQSHSSSASIQAKTPCTCGVFLSGQFIKGSGKQPVGYAALIHEYDEPDACNAMGVKTCTNKCLEMIAKHLPNSSAIICGSVDHDIFKERAHLFVKNCNDTWINTLLSTGKEYCCQDGQHYKCPIL